jgi:hypothetical protein
MDSPAGYLHLGAYAEIGEVEQACALLSESLPRVERAGVNQRFERVVGVRRAHLERYRETSHVKRLDEHLATIEL